MSKWSDMSTASKSEGMWLFLPGSTWRTDEDGRPVPGSIVNEVVKGGWDGGHQCWAQVNRKVFPSMWSDAPLDGPPPDPPVLPGAVP